MEAVKMAADDYKSKLAAMDILLPPQFGDANSPQRDVYLNGLKNVKPVVQGDNIYFYWDNKNPVLLADRVVRNAEGKIMNYPEATASIKLSDAIANTVSVSEGVAEPVVSTRAELMDILKRDVNDFYKPGASIEGEKLVVPAVSATTFRGSAPILVTPKTWSVLKPEQQEMARQRIAENVKYNQLVMKRMTGPAKQKFEKYVEQSNAAAEKSFGRSNRVGIADNREYFTGIGYNYLEMPDWAK
jgi:hypothetical protein